MTHLSTPEPLDSQRSQRADWCGRSGVIIVMSCLVWTLMQKVAYPPLDSHHDMLENFAWSQLALWGTHKHPPFFSWVVGLWFSIMPHKAYLYKLLAYVNVALALWGVLQLADALKLPSLGRPAVILLMWSLPYTTLAAKFNANSQLLSLWPWTAVFLLRSWDSQGWRLALNTLMLALLAAASMLSKYYSGIFLLGLLAASLADPRGRIWLKQPWSYVSVLIFLLLLSPHVHWVMTHDWVTLRYMQDQGTGAIGLKGLLSFSLSPLLYWLPAWLTTVGVGAWALCRAQPQRTVWAVTWRWALQAWQPQGRADVLFWLAFFPWAATLLAGLSGFVDLSTAWAIPIGYAFPLLWLRNYELQIRELQMPSPWTALVRYVYPVLGMMMGLAVAVAWHHAQEEEAHYYRPDRNVASAILSDWHLRHPQAPLKWVGGEWAQSALLSFYGDTSIVVIPDLPESPQAEHYFTGDVLDQPGLIFCSLGPVNVIQADNPRLCEAKAQQWLQERHLPIEPLVFHIQRKGWRFPKSVPFEFVVFHVMPN